MSTAEPDRTDIDLTDLLRRWKHQETGAVRELFQLTYDELHRIAAGRLRREKAGHILQTTALLHEAFMRMQSRRRVQFESRQQFFAFASESMRRVLVDIARARVAAKRGAGVVTVELTDISPGTGGQRATAEDLLDLEQALRDLEAHAPDLSSLVVMKFFGGLKLGEIAEIRGTSISDVKRKWTLARKWLTQQLGAGAGHGTHA